MKTVIVSPHTDDAVFSLGSSLITKPLVVFEDVTIISLFDRIPEDIEGKVKHTTLRSEHANVCKAIGVKELNGEYLDDVYIAKRQLRGIVYWLEQQLHKFDVVFLPLGIHHPDHILTFTFGRMALRNHRTLQKLFLYKELPYGVLYEKEMQGIVNKFDIKAHNIIEHDDKKIDICKMYQSQVDDELLKKLSQKEEYYLI